MGGPERGLRHFVRVSRVLRAQRRTRGQLADGGTARRREDYPPSDGTDQRPTQDAAANGIGFGEIAKKTMATPEGEVKFATGGSWNPIL